MHQSFVTTPRGIAGLKYGAISLLMSRQCRGNNGVLILRSLPKGDFSIVEGRAKSMVLPSSLSLGVGSIAGPWELKSHNPHPSP